MDKNNNLKTEHIILLMLFTLPPLFLLLILIFVNISGSSNKYNIKKDNGKTINGIGYDFSDNSLIIVEPNILLVTLFDCGISKEYSFFIKNSTPNPVRFIFDDSKIKYDPGSINNGQIILPGLTAEIVRNENVLVRLN